MSVTNGLTLALQQALERRDAAAQALAQVRQGWVAAQRQLDQLETYATECTDRWALKQAHCAPEIMRHHYQFMARLTHAIGLQTGIVADIGREFEREAGTLRDAEARLESLRQLHDARRRGERVLQDRREQKQADERAALQYRRLSDHRSGEVSDGR